MPEELSVEIELPPLTLRTREVRKFIVSSMMHAADTYAPGHTVERLGFGSDETHVIHVQAEWEAARLRWFNRDLLRARLRARS